MANGGNRYATVLMYLNDVEEGGETGARLVGGGGAWAGTAGRRQPARWHGDSLEDGQLSPSVLPHQCSCVTASPVSMPPCPPRSVPQHPCT